MVRISQNSIFGCRILPQTIRIPRRGIESSSFLRLNKYLNGFTSSLSRFYATGRRKRRRPAGISSNSSLTSMSYRLIYLSCGIQLFLILSRLFLTFARFYDKSPFHRLVPNFIVSETTRLTIFSLQLNFLCANKFLFPSQIQCGQNSEKADLIEPIKNEFHSRLRFMRRGKYTGKRGGENMVCDNSRTLTEI